MEKNSSAWWEEVKQDISAYLQARAQLTKIQAYEKIAKVTSVMISFFILALLAGLMLVFALLMLGVWISELTHSVGLGSTSVAAAVIGLFIYLSIKRKQVLEKPLSNRIIEALYEEEDFSKQSNPSDLHEQER
jgi:hypothetical protein